MRLHYKLQFSETIIRQYIYIFKNRLTIFTFSADEIILDNFLEQVELVYIFISAHTLEQITDNLFPGEKFIPSVP